MTSLQRLSIALQNPPTKSLLGRNTRFRLAASQGPHLVVVFHVEHQSSGVVTPFIR
jgi:hypothetical protein